MEDTAGRRVGARPESDTHHSNHIPSTRVSLGPHQPAREVGKHDLAMCPERRGNGLGQQAATFENIREAATSHSGRKLEKC